MAGSVTKLSTDRWESVADLARWLLTHADEYEVAVVCLRERRRAAGEAHSDIKTFTCPESPIIEVVGLLEMSKSVYIQEAWEASEGDGWQAS